MARRRSESKKTEISQIADASLVLFYRWSLGKIEVDTIVLYYVIRLLQEFGLPSDGDGVRGDEILENLVPKLLHGRQEQRFGAMLQLALQHLGKLDDAEFRKTKEYFLYDLSGSEQFLQGEFKASTQLHYPMRDMLCHLDLFVQRFEELEEEPEDGQSKSKKRILADRLKQLRDYYLEDQHARTNHFFRTYLGLILSNYMEKAGPNEQYMSDIKQLYHANLAMFRNRKGDDCDLEMETLVMQHSMRISDRFLSKEEKETLWNARISKLIKTATNVHKIKAVKASNVAFHIGKLKCLAPLARMYAYHPDETCVRPYREHFKHGSKRVLKRFHGDAQQRSGDRENEWKVYMHHLTKLMKQSLQIEDLASSRITGGQSDSEVYDVTLKITHPVTVNSRRIVFKVSSEGKHKSEGIKYHDLKECGVEEWFAQSLVLDGDIKKPEKKKPENKPGEREASGDCGMAMYEHLAGYETLRSVLNSELSQEIKVKIISHIAKKLCDITGKVFVKNNGKECKYGSAKIIASADMGPYETIRDELTKDISANITDSITPGFAEEFKHDIRRLKKSTTDLIAEIDRADKVLPTFMHGDLNTGNIMLRPNSEVFKSSEPSQLEMKIIDYGTAKLEDGSLWLDAGELVEDCLHELDPMLEARIEKTVMGILRKSSPYHNTVRLGSETIYYLSRLRTITLHIRNYLREYRELTALPYEVIKRWEGVLAKLRALDDEADLSKKK